MSTMTSLPRWARLLAGALLALAALLAAVYAGLRLAFPPERLNTLLAAQVSGATGRDFAVRGPLSIRLLPRIAIAASDVSLANAPWGTRAQMLQVREARFDVALLPLLRGRVDVANARFEGVDLWLETNRAGIGNWVFDRAPRGEAAAPQPTSSSRAELALQRLELRDARLAYRDGRSASTRDLEVDSLLLDQDGDGQRIEARLASGGQRLQVAGRVGALSALTGTGAAGGADWPFDLRLQGDGLQASAKGAWRSGAAPRTLDADFALTVTQPAALAPWVDAKSLPMPADAKGRLKLQGQALHVDALQLTLAQQALTGKLSAQIGTPLVVDAELSSASLDLQRWLPPRAAAAPSAAATKPRQVFGTTPLGLDALPDLNGTLALHVQRLLAPGLPPLANVNLKIAAQPGRLRADPLAFDIAGGNLTGSLQLAHAGSAPPQVVLRAQGTRMSVDELMRAAGSTGYASGGTLQLRADLSSSGNTPRALAAGANGELMLAVADTTLGRGASPLGTDMLPKVLQALALNPDLKPSTRIECAVIRLPLRDGVATIDRSIGLETSQLAVAARGEVRLTDETLVLAFKPAPKGGLKVNPLDLAQVVVLRGPWQDPKLQLDAQGVAGMAAQLGLAGASGGVSLIAQQLLQSRPETDACRVAMTGRSAQAAPNAAAPSASAPLPAGLPKALPDALRRIFK